ncbi:MAG: Trp operon repressor [Gammaproteobacteria bacterium RIFCSPHIGHO2_12_FULL_45_9]|nr:MAG: Trp operon repressor [Gammaproteobacteria bacterium RIFCSPHIGHO2_12_FULL_45_9]
MLSTTPLEQLLRAADGVGLLTELLYLLLTPEEQQDIADRVQIVQALMQGHNTQRTMASTLDVSIAKITRGSNALKHISPQLADFLKKWAVT